jgi:hypothetical protein
MNRYKYAVSTSVATFCLVIANAGHAAVSAEEAAQLKGPLTPLGAEKAANKDGSIPAWTGGLTQAGKSGGKRADPFAGEKPLFTVTAQNVAKYADKLSDGQQAMLKKYPNYRVDVYKTHRTASAPQWVYDNTFKNATRGKLAKDGYSFEGAYGGIPFPMAKTGVEAMWNSTLAWGGEAMDYDFRIYITTADGQRVLAGNVLVENQWPFFAKDGSPENMRNFHQYRLTVNGPPQKAGEALILQETPDQFNGRQVWQYLTGQRRVRKLPNAAYDTPSFVTSGVSNFDEISLFDGPMDRYDWKLVGKKELIVPYNSNKIYVPSKDGDILSERFLNPDHMRWELHRVWVVEANLLPGKRHVMPKRTYYLDEDTWLAVLSDGWDAKGQLWKTFWRHAVAAPELPGVVPGMFGHYNLQTGDWIANMVMNERPDQIKFVPTRPNSHFSPDSLAGEGVR